MTNLQAEAEQDQERAHLQLVRDYFRAIERNASENELAGFFAPEVRQREFPNRLLPGGAERDLALLLAGSRKGRQVVQNQSYDIRTALARDNRVAVELTWTAELKLPLASTPAGGRLRANCAVFFTMRDGRIVEQHNYDCFDAF
jgi:ketosteroid isomerase-like protein